MAEAEKQLRYPPAAGRRVTTFAIETWGRLGSEAEQVLQQLAAAARRRDLQRDRLAINGIPKWRALIDATNQRSIARRLLAAFLGTDGRPWRPPPLRRDRAHEANTNHLTPGEQLTLPHTGLDPTRLGPWDDDVPWLGPGHDRHDTTGETTPDGRQPGMPEPATSPVTPPATQPAAAAIPGDDTGHHSRSAPPAADCHHLTVTHPNPQPRAARITPAQTLPGSELPQGFMQ